MSEGENIARQKHMLTFYTKRVKKWSHWNAVSGALSSDYREALKLARELIELLKKNITSNELRSLMNTG